jgi:hypothetical protein
MGDFENCRYHHTYFSKIYLPGFQKKKIVGLPITVYLSVIRYLNVLF